MRSWWHRHQNKPVWIGRIGLCRQILSGSDGCAFSSPGQQDSWAAGSAKRCWTAGTTVVGFDNFNDYYAQVHKDRHLVDLLSDPQFQLVKRRSARCTLLRELFQKHKPDAVAHLAGMAAVRYSVQYPLLYADVNVQGSVNVLDAARHSGNADMCAGIHRQRVWADTPVPFVETAAAACPLAPYPASKRAMELFAFSYAHLVETADHRSCDFSTSMARTADRT